MYYRFLFLFVFLLSTFSSHGQTSEGVAEILFPTDIKLQKTIQLIGNTFDFKKKGAFWELSASGNNRKESNKNRSSINPKGQISNYSVELKLDYAINYKIYDIEKMYIDGTGIPLFGKNTAKEQLQAIHEHPSLLYEANKDGTIKRIQIRKMKAIAFLTYSDGNLVNIQLSYDKYGSQRRRFLNSHAKAKIKIACEKQFTPISLEDRIDVTGFEPTCIAHCDPEGKRNPHVMYGNFVFNGPIKNKLPDG
jgi:hypothetical protein